MVQTTVKTGVIYADGAQALIKEEGASSFTDFGVIMSTISAVLNFDKEQLDTANSGELDDHIRNMKIALSFELGNIDLSTMAKLGGGLWEEVTTTTTPVTTSPDQEIAAGWADNTLYNMDIQTSSSDSTQLRASAQPTLTSVTLDPDGTPEVLVEDTEYVVTIDANSPSGYSIQFISANMATGSPTTYEIVIDYSSVTPTSRTTLYVGTSSKILNPSEITIRHTDSSSLVNEINLFAADPDSGAFQFNFKGANEGGINTMPVAITGKLDTSLTDGRQLMSVIRDTGAA